jgi:very-short-patch-repair endonuclease
MSLQTAFQCDRVKELLTAEWCGYYLQSQIDVCVTSTASYLLNLCIEVDGQYYDDSDQQERDAMKNRIFEVGGVPLIRSETLQSVN